MAQTARSGRLDAKAAGARPAKLASSGVGRNGAGRAGGVDSRLVIVGVSVLVVLGIIAFALWSATSGGTSTTPASAAPMGQVTETSVGGPAATAMLPVGAPAPDLQWTLDGKAESVAGLKGTPLVLEFFATWCPHCQAETPTLSRLYARFAPQGLRVLAVNASPVGQDQRVPQSEADMRSYAAKYGATFPLLLDRSLVGAQRYGIRSYPTLYLVDRSGNIAYAQSGEVPEADLAAAIQPLLEGT